VTIILDTVSIISPLPFFLGYPICHTYSDPFSTGTLDKGPESEHPFLYYSIQEYQASIAARFLEESDVVLIEQVVICIWSYSVTVITIPIRTPWSSHASSNVKLADPYITTCFVG
jgi:hypothetical protein